MKLGKWVCSDPRRTAAGSAAWWLLTVLVCAALGLSGGPSQAQAPYAVAPTHAQVIVTDSAEPPAASDPRWRQLPLARDEPGLVAWYRVRFDAPTAAAADQGPPMLYLPYFFGGGRVLLNGVLAAVVPHTTAPCVCAGNAPCCCHCPARR